MRIDHNIARCSYVIQNLDLQPGRVLANFIFKLADGDFLVYINAQSGEEEHILKLLNLPNGTLTL